MKKFIIFGIIIVLLLSACSSTKYPMTEQHEKWGRKALEIADAYLDFEISLEEADEKISSLAGSESALPKDANKEESNGNLIVRTEVSRLDLAFSRAVLKNKGIAVAPGSPDIIAARNSLAEILGVKAR